MIRAPSERPGEASADRPANSEPIYGELRRTATQLTGRLRRRTDAGLQRVVEAAARTYHTSMAIISLLDGQREWFAAQVGLDDVPQAQGFCQHATRGPGEPVVALDTQSDSRFAASPFVTDAPRARFYAGVPLLDRAGDPVGALCVIDDKPRASMPSLFQLIRLAREAEQIIAH